MLNLFNVAEDDIPALMSAWEKDADGMKQQPGFLSTQLHRSTGDRRRARQGSIIRVNHDLPDTPLLPLPARAANNRGFSP
jgi:hypothetical protein